MADRIQLRRDTAERWASVNPILLEGEIGYVIDNPNQHKIGDGVHAWNDLPLRGFNGTISQQTGDDENAVISQKVVTEKILDLHSRADVLQSTKASKDELSAESNRAKLAEQELSGRVDLKASKVELQSETNRSLKAEQALSLRIDDESERAKEAEAEQRGDFEANKFGFNVTVYGEHGGVHNLLSAIKDMPKKYRMLGQKITFRTENGDWATYHNESLSLANYENTKDWVQEVGVKEVTGDVNIENAPDYEDLTEAGNGTIKFADKEYSKSSFSGLGRIYIRKNIVNGVNILTQDMIIKENTRYIIQYDYNLNGATVEVPEGCVLEFQGGSLINGSVVGKNTEVSTESGGIFSGIVIEGTWRISSVYSNWFDFVEGGYDNIQNFRNLMTLAKSDIYTHVYIQEGEFYTSTWTNDDNGEYESAVGIDVPSNVYIHNSATIKEVANPYEKTSMFFLNRVENITIEGGKLVGGIENHTGTTGEWGMGIHPHAVKNLIVKNIEISEFWGDGIDIQSPYSDYTNQTATGHCQNVLIDNVRCLNNRRQGMSVEAVDGLIVRDSEFSGTGSIKSTSPGAGIDIEPWHEWQVCRNITIENCKMFGNENMLLIHLPPAYNQVHNIRILNCHSNKGIWTKNVNGLYVDGYHSDNGNSYVCLWNKGDNITIKNSSFSNEIYLDGQLNNVKFLGCNINITSPAVWAGYGIYVAGGGTKAYSNILFEQCYINSQSRMASIRVDANNTSIDFSKCMIEDYASGRFYIGYGNMIGNDIILHKANGMAFVNKKGDTVKLYGNTITTHSYSEPLLSFWDENSVASDTKFDYEFVNNRFIPIGSYYTPIGGGKENVVKCKMYGNTFDVDISDFIPESWFYMSNNEQSEFHYKTKTNMARTNIYANECYRITIPYKRCSLKVSIIHADTTYTTMVASDTTFSVDTTGNVVDFFTDFKKPIKLDEYYNIIMPVFATKVDGENLYIYVNEMSGNAKNFNLRTELLSQTESKLNTIKIDRVATPSDAQFLVHILSPCHTQSLDLKPFIGLYKGMQVAYKGSMVTYNGEKWIDSNGNEVGYLTNGTTSERPDVVVGTFYFDTTISKPIWKVADGWVDATGKKV